LIACLRIALRVSSRTTGTYREGSNADHIVRKQVSRELSLLTRVLDKDSNRAATLEVPLALSGKLAHIPASLGGKVAP
jgi:hypothetical protein